MKRFLLTATLGLATANLGWCTIDTYTNKSYVTTVPLTPIDATNFVNLNLFSFSTGWPYDFSNVRNYTNRSTMANSGSGFRFDTVPTAGSRYMARSFYNGSLAGNFSTNASVFGGYRILVSATNIVNRGLLGVNSFGLIQLDGKDLDLGRSALQVGTWSDRQPLYPEAVFDEEWGLDGVTFAPDGFVVADSPSTPGYGVTFFFPSSIFSPYANGRTSMSLFDLAGASLTSAQVINEAETNRSVQYVFVRNPNTNIQVSIKYFPNPNQNPPPAPPQVPVILWQAFGTNAFGQTITNSLLLEDLFAVMNNVNLIENYPFASQPPQSVPIPPATYQPTNFVVSRIAPFGWDFLDDPDPFEEPAPEIWTTNTRPERVDASYSAYAFRLASSTTDPSQLSQTAITNIRTGPGRIEMNASGKLDLNLTRIDGLNYLKINATNHFSGASNATMYSTYSDVSLGSTNGMLDTRGLLASSLPHLNGTVRCFSAKWQNLVFYENGSTNMCDFHVLWVDSDLQETAPSEILSLALRSTNAFVSDTFSVIDKLDLNVQNLTIRDDGMIQSLQPDLRWASNVRNVVTLTNYGILNFLQMSDEMRLYNLGANENPVPYGVFANYGSVYNNACTILATNIHNGIGGYLYSSYGPVTMQAISNVTINSGFVSAPNADINISCRNLMVTNAFLMPGRSLVMSISDSLSSGANSWTVQDGFHLLTKPATGDFSQTVIIDEGYEFAEVFHTWAGEDRGASVAGFTNNAALGQLELDGGLNTLFTFNGAGPGNNALYVDVLVLRNAATNIVNGSLAALNISSGMKIYFSQAFIDDGFGGLTSITSQLTNTVGLVQVDHTGPLSLPKQALSFNPALKVAIEKEPTLRSKVTWDTPPGATNYLYRIANPYSSNWQLVTNFVSGSTGGPVSVFEPVQDITRFYKVRVDVKAP